ncbi:methyltransferase [Methylogaea oryzae]|uniref:Methyltransferase n=1 Tax=Methylogaea oryzae TaxID=1295382 RepID=A0A8D5AL73_9GAMM|nr:methyltransferase [Methylogaea oryzae]BBL69870.1 methyltransferase [Methylogaea oryzae]
MSKEPISIGRREKELSVYLERQPYFVEQDGIRLKIAKNVFPSDFGITSSFVGDFMLRQQPVGVALDMACGSGYFAFLLKKIGCSTVYGVDFNRDAVACAKENLGLNPALAPIEFIHSDLFADVPPVKLDAIMFNFNYYPSDGTYGLNADGGREILERFFRQVPAYINDGARIYIPYSQFVGEEHDPKRIGAAFGFACSVAASVANEAGEHYIYEITKT